MAPAGNIPPLDDRPPAAGPGRQTTRLRAAFLLPVVAVIAIMAALPVTELFVLERTEIAREIERVRAGLNKMYQDDLVHNRAMLHAVMEVIQLDPALYRALARKDRAELMARTMPTFPGLNEKFHIAQFYFSGPDRVNLLRVHRPEQHGDVIDRYTTLEAERTGVMARGVELDPDGNLTLRMVHPWYLEPSWHIGPPEHLIGYFELGMDVDHILRGVQDFLGVPVVVLISKQYLERAAWETGMRKRGRTPDWDRFPETVLNLQATHDVAPAIAAALARFPAAEPDAAIEAEQGRESYRLTAAPLADAAGRPVAWMVAVIDVSRHAATARRAVWAASALALAASGALSLFFWWLVGRVGRRLERDESELVRFRASMDATADCLILIDPQTLRIVDFNRMAVQRLGFAPEELLAMGPQDLARGKTREDFAQLFAGLAHAPPEGVTQEAACRHKDDSDHPVEVSFTLFAPSGAPPLVIALARDITERKRAEEALRASEEKFRSLVETTSDFVWEVDCNGVYTYVSPRVRDLLGFTPEEVVGKTAFDLMPPDEARRVAGAFTSLVAGRQPIVALENVNRHKDGHLVVLETSATPFFQPDGSLGGYRGIDRDITERKRIEAERVQLMKQLDELASHDGLTGLYNHRMFYKLLEDELARAKRFKHPVSLLMIDIDHFKQVNDTYGHQAGDAIIKGLGNLLGRQARTIDRVCRYGGEEITVILAETENTAALGIAERLRAAVEQESFDIGNSHIVHITVSIGFAAWPAHAATGDELVSAADAAMYAAKQAGRNRVCRYEKGIAVRDN